MPRTLLAALLGTGLLAPVAGASVTTPGPTTAAPLSTTPPATLSTAPAAVSYEAPLAGGLRVRWPFDPPATPYGPGHLGVDLAAAEGAAVRTAGPGVVTFAGAIAGRGVLVVAHPDGIRTEYEPVRVLVRAGTPVAAGQVIGRISGSHRGCAPATCLHWGARRGTVYLDPLALLRPLAPVRLLPWPRPG